MSRIVYVSLYEGCALCDGTRRRSCPRCQTLIAEGRRAPYPRRDRKQERASRLVSDAVLAGRMVKGPCVAAGPRCSRRITGHHHDYSKPMDVVWVCDRHHRILDRERRRGTPLELAVAKLANAWRASDAA